MIHVECKRCGELYQAKDRKAGSTFTCDCGQRVRVPSYDDDDPKVRCYDCGRSVPGPMAWRKEVSTSRTVGMTNIGGQMSMLGTMNYETVDLCPDCYEDRLDDDARVASGFSTVMWTCIGVVGGLLLLLLVVIAGR